MLWDEQVTVSSGVGYKNNVLLSPYNQRGSAFNIDGIDLMVMRVPVDGWQIVGSLIGDDTRYWQNVGTDREDTFIGSVQIQRMFSPGWQAGLEVRGLYEDEVLDISLDQGSPTTVLVEGFALTVQPSLRKELGESFWLKVEMPVSRWLLAAPMDDYWEFGPVATAGYNFGRQSDVTLSYGATFQPHDTWVALDQFGRIPPENPQLLNIFQQRTELAWHQYWDAHRRWRSSTRAVLVWKEDNGSGYFNYFQYQLIEDLRWQTKDWKIQGSVQLANEDYPVQKIGTKTHSSTTLSRAIWEVSLEAEHRLYRGVKGFARLQYDRCLSNEAESAGNYNATTISGGLRYEF